MLDSVKVLALALLIGLPASAAGTLQQCKTLCKTELKPACESACRKQPKKHVESCLKEMCELAMSKCDLMCEENSKRK